MIVHGSPLLRKSSACEVSQSTVLRGSRTKVELVEGLRGMRAKGDENAFFEMLDCFDESVGRLKGLLKIVEAARIRCLARIIHRGWAELREAVLRSVVFGGVGDAGNRGLKLRCGPSSGASRPVGYGGNFAIRPARLAKPA